MSSGGELVNLRAELAASRAENDQHRQEQAESSTIIGALRNALERAAESREVTDWLTDWLTRLTRLTD